MRYIMFFHRIVETENIFFFQLTGLWILKLTGSYRFKLVIVYTKVITKMLCKRS